jgi:hypothetical protein
VEALQSLLFQLSVSLHSGARVEQHLPLVALPRLGIGNLFGALEEVLQSQPAPYLVRQVWEQESQPSAHLLRLVRQLVVQHPLALQQTKLQRHPLEPRVITIRLQSPLLDLLAHLLAEAPRHHLALWHRTSLRLHSKQSKVSLLLQQVALLLAARQQLALV